MPARPNFITCRRDPNFLAASPASRDLRSYRRWLVGNCAADGLPLSLVADLFDGGKAEAEQIFCADSGLPAYDPPPGGWPVVVNLSGRQGGKTSNIRDRAVYSGVTADPDPYGGDRYVVIVAQDSRAAIRTALSYVRGIFQASPMLRNFIVGETADTITLQNGVKIAVYPCRPSAVRGIRALAFFCDELAHFRGSDGNRMDHEMLVAARPTLATTGGKLFISSTPYGQSGELWELVRRYYGKPNPHTLVLKATAPQLNPTLPADYLERMKQEDPEAYRSEVLGEFRAGLSTLLDPDALDACVAHGRPLELPPRRSVTSKGFADLSAGRRDAAAAAIGFRTTDGRAVAAALRAWPAPHSPAAVVAEMADVFRTYGVSKVVGDRFAGEWPREAFALQGIRYEPAARPKSDLYLDFLAYVNSGRVELPDDPKLLHELRGLERRRGSSGRDRVDHAPGAHDDRANAVAGLAQLLLGKRPRRTLEEEGIDDLWSYLFGGGGRSWWPSSWPTSWQLQDPRYDPDDETADPRFRRVSAATELGDEGDY